MTLTAVPTETRSRRTAAIALVLVTAVWGSTFGLSKDLLERLPVADYLGSRYLVAAAVLLVVCPRLVRGLTPHTVRVGIGLGTLYAGAQLLQFHGLAQTEPTVSAFVVAMYVVFTPLFVAVLPGRGVDGVTWAAVAVATTGVAVMSLRGWAFGTGELLTLVSAALYAVHILALGRWARPDEAFALTFFQLATMGVLLTGVGSADGLELPGRGDLLAFFYLAAIAGTVTLLVQTWAQGHLESGQAAVLMVLEPVWAAAFGALLWHETLGPRTLGGGALVLLAMLMVVVRPDARVPDPPASLPEGVA
ncbi:DMT family transporter [Nocardioides sp. CPCC 206347]|uniref:DMT family transporter n=1 Tax=unclassified Nocardioides TaxID=2615069 RepID=UPI00360C95E5